MKKWIFALLLAAILLVGCQKGNSPPSRSAIDSTELQFTIPAEGSQIAIFDTSAGEIRAVLYPELTPMAVDNFVGLAQQGYYNGTGFHKIVYNSYIQGGDATGTGSGSRTIWNADSFPLEANGSLRHYTGALCVAFDQDTGGGTSQFYFVVTAPGIDSSTMQKLKDSGQYSDEAIKAYQAAGGLPMLDNTDTVFGQIYQGQEIADAIACQAVNEDGSPVQAITINSITITAYSAAGEEAAG